MSRDELEQELKQLEERMTHYMPKFLEKKKVFRGVKHEDSLSELRYTEFMVYKDIVEGLQKKIYEVKTKLRNLHI